MRDASDRRRVRAWALGVALVASTVVAAPADAAPPRSRGAQLFEEGRDLLSRGRVAEACARLEESDAVDPGVGTVGLLATCWERQGKLASAWRAYLDTAQRAAAAGDDRQAYAAERAAALEPRLPRVVLTVRGAAQAKVTLGGRALDPDELGVPTFVDPGLTVAEAVATDGRRVTRSIDARAGETVRVELVLGSEPPDPSAATVPAADGGTEAGTEGTPMWPAWIGFGVGAVGLGMMGVGSAVAISRNASSDDLAATCEARGEGCDEGRDERDAARSAAGIATAGLVVGAVGLAAGAGFTIAHVATSGSAPATALRVTVVSAPGAASLGFRGRF